MLHILGIIFGVLMFVIGLVGVFYFLSGILLCAGLYYCIWREMDRWENEDDSDDSYED